MSFFSEETEPQVQSHTLWAERYRPSVVQDYICDDHLKEILNDFIKRKDIPHLLFHGGAGTGKTTLAKILTKNIPSDVIYINASDTNGIEMVRTKIKGFAGSSGFQSLKIVILDEADFFTTEAQAALRNLMETYSHSTRFILTCNYVEKIIMPLISRCQVFEIEPPTKKDVAVYVRNILDKESIKYELAELKTVLDNFYPDIRKVINYLQQSSTSGTLKLVKTQNASVDLKSSLVSILKNSKTNPKAFNEIRQLVADAGTKMFDELYSELYDKASEYAPGKEIAVIIEVAEYVYQSSMVVDKEITFMACIAKLVKTIGK